VNGREADARDTALDQRSLFALADGPLRRQLERHGLVRDGRVDAGRAAVLSVFVTWLPLLALSLVEGVAWNGGLQVPLLKDFLPYGQFLIAVPALVLAELVIGRRLALAVAELRRSDVLSPADRPALDALILRARVAWGGQIVNGVILVLTIGASIASVIEVRDWLTGGWQYTDDRMTLPGWWYLLVSLPVMRFLALRWLWRLLVWAWVLWRVSAMRLRPRPSHPDRAGGLAFLGEAQIAFGLLVLAFGVQLSCLTADQVWFEGGSLVAFRAYLSSFVLISVCVLLLPLLAFVPKLARARFDSLLFLSGRGFEGAGALEEKLRGTAGPELPHSGISELTDYGVLYDNARLMRSVPLEWRHIGVLVLAAVLPFVPLVFLVVPAQEVLRTLAQLLI
jgi:hypothetical protein